MPELTHDCPGGCGAQVARAQLSCKADWFRLPKLLRDEVNAAYRRRDTDRGRHLLALVAAQRWYDEHPRAEAARAASTQRYSTPLHSTAEEPS